MLSKETIIKITNSIADWSESLVGVRYNAGVIISLFHLIIVATISYLFFFSSTCLGFYIGIVGVLTIIILHFIFSGCFLLRLERTLLNDKQWYGSYNLLFFTLEKLGAPISNKGTICYYVASVIALIMIYLIYVKLCARLT